MEPGSLHTPTDFNGIIELNYSVADTNGASTNAAHRIEIKPVNDAPTTSSPIDLGEIDEDSSIRITNEQLLKTSSDVDGDELQVRNLSVSQGEGKLKLNNDGSWTFNPFLDWHGELALSYEVSDSLLGTKASAVLKVNFR